MSSPEPQDLSFLVIPLHEPFLRYSLPRVGDINAVVDDHVSKHDSDSGRSSMDGSTSSGDEHILNDVLDGMFPVLKWTEIQEDDTEIGLTQTISRIPSNRLDAVALRNTLDASLEKYQAKETGVCSIRRILYDKTIDELIRQITVNCIHQGQLLFRLRNEFRMTIDAYRVLFTSAIAFGLRYALRSQKRSLDIEMEKRDIMDEKEELKNKLFTLQKVHEATLSKHEESMNGVTTQYQEEVAKLRLMIDKQSRLIDVLNRRPIKL